MTEQIRYDLERALGRRVLFVNPIAEGHSGFTYSVSTEDGDYVLRLPPPGARIAGTADVMRQGRIMAALNAVGLPTPAVPVICSDPIVDGRPFILMRRIEGVRIEQASQRERPLDIAAAAVHVLHRLQSLRRADTGIGDEEPVTLQVEMVRWAILMQRAPEELTERAGELGGMLAANVPVEREPTLVHGDYHYGNMLFRGHDVVAVLDWEIAELGQPLLDLGCLCVMSVRQQIAEAPNPGGAIDLGIEDLYRLYGADQSEMRWYTAMSLYKYAAILGYNTMLHRRGKRPDPMYERMGDTIVRMIEAGIDLFDRV